MSQLTLIVQGPAHAGKGHLMAYLSHLLRQAGAEVQVQGEQTHNKPKFDKPADELLARLASCRVVVREEQTRT